MSAVCAQACESRSHDTQNTEPIIINTTGGKKLHREPLR